MTDNYAVLPNFTALMTDNYAVLPNFTALMSDNYAVLPNFTALMSAILMLEIRNTNGNLAEQLIGWRKLGKPKRRENNIKTETNEIHCFSLWIELLQDRIKWLHSTFGFDTQRDRLLSAPVYLASEVLSRGTGSVRYGLVTQRDATDKTSCAVGSFHCDTCALFILFVQRINVILDGSSKQNTRTACSANLPPSSPPAYWMSS
jgi:hypothetical protein